MFQIIKVDNRQAEAPEQLGTKRKFWFANHEMLFKAEERGTGDDWAEKSVCHLAGLIGLPHVHYELAAEYSGATYILPGVVCRTCAPPPLELVLGNQLLLRRDPRYPANIGQRYKVREHTVDAVAEIVRKLERPSLEWASTMPQGINTALDTFIGYVMLDAWVANQDRHHENWGALRSDRLRLAPTFDHGASLARNLTEEEMSNRLHTRDANYTVQRFAERARSAFYATGSDNPLTTLEAFRAFAGFSVPAARLWLDRLASTRRDDVVSIVNEVPPMRMSGVTKEFVLELLAVNQERLVNERNQL
jgi:hypothetical protein